MAATGIRARVRSSRSGALAWRIGVGLAGAAVIVVGLLLLPLPGPGWVVIFLGLGLLATEFVWAGRLLAFARRTLGEWTRWLAARPWPVRGLVGLSSVVVVLAALWVAGRIVGMPHWVPAPLR